MRQTTHAKIGAKRLFDFYIAAAEGIDQTELQVALDHLLVSVIVHGGGQVPATPVAGQA